MNRRTIERALRWCLRRVVPPLALAGLFSISMWLQKRQAHQHERGS